MDFTELLEPVLTNGIRVNNFFNGRVLTAEDLSAEQRANRAQHRQLALAVGEGVVRGLDVRAGTADDGTPLLTVSPGLAFTREGDAVALGREARVRLVSEARAAQADAGLFAVCQPRSDALELTDVGLWVLTASPASGLSAERAPVVELGSDGVAGACASRWAQEGARFAVAPLPLAAPGTTPTPLATELAGRVEDVEEDVERVLRGGASDTPAVRDRLSRNLSLLRSGAAYLCFGADTLAARRAKPLADDGFPDPRHGAVDGMRERAELKACEVPLALFYLSARGIEWVDAWAVRRPPVPAVTAGALASFPGARPAAEALAMVLHFQQQLRELAESDLSNTALAAVEAAARFRFLPPIGFVPVMGFGAARGMNLPVFFRALASTQPAPLDPGHLAVLVAAAAAHDPIDLSRPQALQLFRLTAASEGARPPWVAFTRRGLRAVPEDDAVAQTLRQAWEAYRSVARRRVFLPLEAGTNAVGTRASINATLADVLTVAAQSAERAEAGTLDRAGALRAFERLHGVQKEVAVLFQSLANTLAGHAQRQEFAGVLTRFLDQTITGGITALDPALDAGDLQGAVRAQDAINRYVAGWTGEGIAIGTISLRQTANTGNRLVPGSPTPFTYQYELRNATDKEIRIRVEAQVGARAAGTALTGDWPGRVTVAPTGISTAGIVIPSRENRAVTVSVSPPGDAEPGELARLTVTATAVEPNNQTDTETFDVEISEEEGEPMTRFLEFTNVVRPPSFVLSAAQPGSTLNFAFDIRYTASDEPLVASFAFEIVPVTPAAGWQVQIPGAASGGLSVDRLLTAGAAPEAHRTPVAVTAPTLGGRTFTFRARISSTVLGISDESDPITITTAAAS